MGAALKQLNACHVGGGLMSLCSIPQGRTKVTQKNLRRDQVAPISAKAGSSAVQQENLLFTK